MDSACDSGKILMESLFGNFDQESLMILSFWQMTHERFESQKNDSISALDITVEKECHFIFHKWIDNAVLNIFLIKL